MPLFKPDNVNSTVLSQFSLAGKICAVTGGTGGIGLEIVRGLAEAGADVALLYNSNADAARKATAAIAAATGVRVEAFQCNVANRQQTHDVVTRTIAEGFGRGRLDVMVANAGVCADIPALEYDEASWAGQNAVNYDGVMWTAQAAGSVFKSQGKGNLIITASMSATLVNVPQRQAGYNAGKAAVVHLGKSLAVEWADFARVNMVSPGYVMTEMLTRQPEERLEKWMSMIPGGRICDAAELKSAYVFLAGDSCSYMTGANMVIDGGATLP